jgi:hypothetical protein
MCHNMIIGARVAREMLEAGEYENVVSKWATEARRRGENSKFFKLWQEETNAGRGPKALEKLPPDERTPWQKLWQDVDALLAKTQEKKEDA